MAKVRATDGGCHEWQSTIHRDGYGKFFFEGRQDRAHRVAFRLFVGDTNRLAVLHRCDNRKCVNPDHLFLGTAQDNVTDMDKKGRRGSRCKLTAEQAANIKRLLHVHSQNYLAGLYNVDQSTISRIKLNRISHFKE